jgi:hypothetical protein
MKVFNFYDSMTNKRKPLAPKGDKRFFKAGEKSFLIR